MGRSPSSDAGPPRADGQHERFSVVAFADEAVLAIVDAIRREIPPRVAVMPAHVTLKGSFVEPVSLATIEERVERIAAQATPLRVEVDRIHTGEKHLGLSLVPGPELVALHDSLFHVLADLVTDVYGDKPGEGYRPHLTVLYGLVPEEGIRAEGLLGRLGLVRSIGLREVSLVGRVGGAENGVWEAIRRWPMRGEEWPPRKSS